RGGVGAMLIFQHLGLRLGLLLSGVLPVEAEELHARAGVARVSASPNERASYAARGATSPDRFAREMRMVGRVVGIDPTLLRAVVMQESSGNPAALSEAGAIRLTQLMPVAIRQDGGEATRVLGPPVAPRG